MKHNQCESIIYIAVCFIYYTQAKYLIEITQIIGGTGHLKKKKQNLYAYMVLQSYIFFSKS